MKVFRTVQKHYATLDIDPSNQSTLENPFNKRVLGFSLLECNIVLHILYILYVANGFVEYVECICSLSAGIITFVCFAAIAFRKSTLFKCIDNIEKLIDTRSKYPKSEAFFWKINQQVEQFCKIVFTVVVRIPPLCLILPRCIVSYSNYFINDMGTDSFQLPIPLWFPFDWGNPMGYLMAVIVEYTIFGYAYIMIACTLALGIGAFWFATAASKEIQSVLYSINEKAETKESQSNELMVLLSEYIHAHGIVKQVEHDFSDIFQPIFMSLFTWSLLSISAVMLIIQVHIIHHGSVQMLFLPLVNGIMGLILVYIACELGQRMSDAFEKIDLTIEQTDWYLFPINVQRMLPFIIVIAQQPVSLECFGSIPCSRTIFRKVINRAYSYYTVLSQIGD